MFKCKILIHGPYDGSARRLAELLNGLPAVSLIIQDSFLLSDSALAGQKLQVVFVPLSLDAETISARILCAHPEIHIVFFATSPGYPETRAAFVHGAADVIDTDRITAAELYSVLQRTIRSNTPVPADGPHLHDLLFRGEHIAQFLQTTARFSHTGKGKKFIFLRADVLCRRQSLIWQQEAAFLWTKKFGVGNCFILNSDPGTLKLGAFIEQLFTPDVLVSMYRSQLQLFLDSLKAFDCIGAACFHVDKSISMSHLLRLNQLSELVYYLDESQVIPFDQPQVNTVLSDDLYERFYKAASFNDLRSIIDCINSTVASLKKDMPAPSYAIAKLNRFLWDYAIAVGSHGEESMFLPIDNSRITPHMDSLIHFFSTISQQRSSAIAPSPLDELIHRIEFDPGMEISINQAAQETNFSRSYFCKLFRERTGMSFTEFLNSKRIDNACKQLEKTNMRIDDIAHLIGISNVWYFKKLFIKHKGIHPEEWRKRARNPSDVESGSASGAPPSSDNPSTGAT